MEAILHRLGTAPQRQLSDRPWVTLTWAQSLDGKLSALETAQTIISGPSSMQMTHALRATHDTILVGSNTITVDNPRLTTRLTSSTEDILQSIPELLDKKTSTSFASPVPIILDSHLRTKSDARCLQQERDNPWKPFIFHSRNATEHTSLNTVAELIPVPNVDGSTHYLDLSSVLSELHCRHVKSVMVEGGPSVLSSFFAANLWDMIIITVAPTIFGGGPALRAPKNVRNCFSNLRFSECEWHQFGDDTVLIGSPDRQMW